MDYNEINFGIDALVSIVFGAGVNSGGFEVHTGTKTTTTCSVVTFNAANANALVAAGIDWIAIGTKP